jgi:hypothetical protein
MKFDVTYWVPRQFAAVAGEDEVLGALREYADQDYGLSYTVRARTVITQLEQGFEPSDTGIIALALREACFEAPKGTEPEQSDEAYDYTADIRPS